MGTFDGVSVGLLVGCSVTDVGEGVETGDFVGRSDGLFVGSFVLSVGLSVGTFVGDSVGSDVLSGQKGLMSSEQQPQDSPAWMGLEPSAKLTHLLMMSPLPWLFLPQIA